MKGEWCDPGMGKSPANPKDINDSQQWKNQKRVVLAGTLWRKDRGTKWSRGEREGPEARGSQRP